MKPVKSIVRWRFDKKLRFQKTFPSRAAAQRYADRTAHLWNVTPTVERVRSYGFSCFNCHAMLETPYNTARRAEDFAGDRGWVIGHSNGQGHIGCPDCASALHDPRSLRRI